MMKDKPKKQLEKLTSLFTKEQLSKTLRGQ
jgi:hypothetical protein